MLLVLLVLLNDCSEGNCDSQWTEPHFENWDGIEEGEQTERKVGLNRVVRDIGEWDVEKRMESEHEMEYWIQYLGSGSWKIWHWLGYRGEVVVVGVVRIGVIWTGVLKRRCRVGWVAWIWRVQHQLSTCWRWKSVIRHGCERKRTINIRTEQKQQKKEMSYAVHGVRRAYENRLLQLKMNKQLRPNDYRMQCPWKVRDQLDKEWSDMLCVPNCKHLSVSRNRIKAIN